MNSFLFQIPARPKGFRSFLVYSILCVLSVGISENIGLAHDILDSEIPHQNVEPDKFVPKGKIKEEASVGDYLVRVYREKYEGSFEILKNGKRVYARLGEHFYISCSSKAGKIPVGKSITGEGKPNLIISEFSGGNSCCAYMHVFEIGPTFRVIGEIELLEADEACFEEIDGDPNLIIKGVDNVFKCWEASCVASPAPYVIYQYKDGRFQVALDIMKKMGPDIKSLDRKASFFRENGISLNQDKLAELWEIMLDLIYSGHADVAWDFFDKAWPNGKTGKNQFLIEFKSQLAKSRFWPEIKAMNNIR